MHMYVCIYIYTYYVYIYIYIYHMILLCCVYASPNLMIDIKPLTSCITVN